MISTTWPILVSFVHPGEENLPYLFHMLFLQAEEEEEEEEGRKSTTHIRETFQTWD